MSLQTLSREFVTLFQQENCRGAAGLLPKIKLEYAKEGLMAPSSAFSKEDLMAARQLLEMGVIVEIHAGASAAEIDRLFAQLRPFYDPKLKLAASDNESKLMALHLLLLLTNNEIAEFHTELETLSNAENDKYLQYPVKLERWLMEGAYDKAWQAVTEKSQFPAPEFAILTQGLQSTIRNEIAASSEKAYSSLPFANARHLLFFTSDDDLTEFAQARDWTVSNGRVNFAKVEEEEQVASTEGLISSMLAYASQIETII